MTKASSLELAAIGLCVEFCSLTLKNFPPGPFAGCEAAVLPDLCLVSYCMDPGLPSVAPGQQEGFQAVHST